MRHESGRLGAAPPPCLHDVISGDLLLQLLHASGVLHAEKDLATLVGQLDGRRDGLLQARVIGVALGRVLRSRVASVSNKKKGQ